MQLNWLRVISRHESISDNYRSNEWVLTAASLTRNYRRNGKSFIAFEILVFSFPFSLPLSFYILSLRSFVRIILCSSTHLVHFAFRIITFLISRMKNASSIANCRGKEKWDIDFKLILLRVKKKNYFINERNLEFLWLRLKICENIYNCWR